MFLYISCATAETGLWASAIWHVLHNERKFSEWEQRKKNSARVIAASVCPSAEKNPGMCVWLFPSSEKTRKWENFVYLYRAAAAGGCAAGSPHESRTHKTRATWERCVMRRCEGKSHEEKKRKERRTEKGRRIGCRVQWLFVTSSATKRMHTCKRVPTVWCACGCNGKVRGVAVLRVCLLQRCVSRPFRGASKYRIGAVQ